MIKVTLSAEREGGLGGGQRGGRGEQAWKDGCRGTVMSKLCANSGGQQRSATFK